MQELFSTSALCKIRRVRPHPLDLSTASRASILMYDTLPDLTSKHTRSSTWQYYLVVQGRRVGEESRFGTCWAETVWAGDIKLGIG